VLGSGDSDLQVRYRAADNSRSGRVGVSIGHDEGLAHLIQAGVDAIVVPSRFEPCGLTQLCALRYGTVPIVSVSAGWRIRYSTQEIGRLRAADKPGSIWTGHHGKSCRRPAAGLRHVSRRGCLATDSAQRHVDRRVVARSSEPLRLICIADGPVAPGKSCLEFGLAEISLRRGRMITVAFVVRFIASAAYREDSRQDG